MTYPQDGVDPYRYGAPEPAGYPGAGYPAPGYPAGPSRPTGKMILSSAWQLLKQDRKLIVLPLMGSALSLVAFLVIFLPGLAIAIDSNHDKIVIYAFVILGGFVASVIGIFFQAALVAGAYQRADGFEPTVGSTMRAAWQLRRQVLGWAVFTTIVGTIIRAVEQRLGILGKIVGFLGGIAWAIATFFVVPVIVAEGVGPIEAIKRSSGTVKRIWGTGVRTTLRFGVLQLVLLVPIALAVLGGVLIASTGASAGGSVGGGLLLLIGVAAFFGLSLVLGAVATYARAVIYRWTTGRPVPGIDPALFAGAFAPRRGRRG